MNKLILFLFIIALGITIGGGLYETLVVMPTWVSAPPDSVLAFHRHNQASPQFALNAGGRFWIFLTPSLGLLSIATLISSFWTHPTHRKWRLAASLISLAVVVFTFVWFIPNIIALMGDAVTAMNPENVSSLATRWERLNWVRAILYIAAWIAALKALSVPSHPKADI